MGGQGPLSRGDQPTAVVFDIGGVLLDWDPRHLYRKLFDDEAEMDRFLAEVCTLEWHHAHDLGVPPEETSPPLIAAHPQYAEHIWAWTQRTEEMVGGPIEGSVEILRSLRATGVRCYALTNMETWTFPDRRERYPFLRELDGALVSGFEGVAKPDRRVFELLLERFDLDPTRTVFVDDSRANVEAARSVGLRAVHFESPPLLREWLERTGLLAA